MLKKVTKLTSDNINSMVSTLASDTVTEFFADSTFDNDVLKSLKQKLEALDSDNTAEIKLDLSQSSVTEIWESGIISNRVTSLTIPNTLTGAIWAVKLPSSIRLIEGNNFSYCNALVEVHFGSSTPPSVNGTIFTSPNESLRIYVPSSAKSAYLNATGANGFAGAKNALSDSLASKIIEE